MNQFRGREKFKSSRPGVSKRRWWAKRNLRPHFVNKDLLEHSRVHLLTERPTAELSRCSRHCMIRRVWYICYRALSRKSLQPLITHCLGPRMCCERRAAELPRNTQGYISSSTVFFSYKIMKKKIKRHP